MRSRKRAGGRRVVLALGLIAAAVLLIHFKGFGNAVPRGGSGLAGQEPAASDGAVSADTLQALEALAKTAPEIGPVLRHPEKYPARLLESLARNPELLDFTLDYPEKKGTLADQIDLSGEARRGGIPLLMQWDERWGYAPYGGGIIALDGCGPTCLSMVAVGLTGDISRNPEAVAAFSERNGYLDAKSGSTLWTLMSEGAEKLGLKSAELPLDRARMARELSEGHPIICSLRPGDFTTVGHFVVLCGYRDGAFDVRDPNSRGRSGKTWSYETLKPQIRNLWAFSA